MLGIFAGLIGVVFFMEALEATAKPQILRSCFAVRIRYYGNVPRAHHGEDHNACRVVVIAAYDMRIDFIKLKLPYE